MVVIIGAGVVGAATAYYLSSACGTMPITVLDAVGPAAGSSGKAGAFLTNEPPAYRRGTGKDTDDKRQQLFEASFDLHRKLAVDLELESFCLVQNYRSISSENPICPLGSDTSSQHDTWLAKIGEKGMELHGKAVIVDPTELTSKLLDTALSKSNVSFLQANVSGLNLDDSGRFVEGIRVEGNNALDSIQIDQDKAIVIALGPWSCRVEDWLGIPLPIEGVLSTSMIYQNASPSANIGTAFFFEDDSNGCHLEVFARKDKSLYVSGCGESEAISTRLLRSTDRPSPMVPCRPDLARAAAAQKSLHGLGWCSDPDTIQACIRPMSPDGVPVVGKILDNVYVATGGGPWGITWGPLMGQTLASLINENDEPPIRLGSMSPKRYDTLVYKTLLKSRAT